MVHNLESHPGQHLSEAPHTKPQLELKMSRDLNKHTTPGLIHLEEACDLEKSPSNLPGPKPSSLQGEVHTYHDVQP